MSEPQPGIWVDADALPAVIRDTLYKAALRTGVPLTLVANRHIDTPSARQIRSLQVSAGYDVADNEILRRAEPGDLVITQDIPLAAELVAKGAEVVTPRGEQLPRDNIRPRLNMRDFMDSLRSSGIHGGGQSAFGPRDRQAFANCLDRWLARNART